MNLIMAMKKSALIHGHVEIAFIILTNLGITRTGVYSALSAQFIIAINDGVSLAKRPDRIR